MNALPYAALLLALLLAGCGGSPPSAIGPTSSTAPTEAPSAVASSDLGAIEGIVVDASFAPIAGANVSLETASMPHTELQRGTTAPDGAFAFSLVEPATYRVKAVVAGYDNRSVLVDVTPGEVAKLTITVDALPSPEPYVLLFEKTGFFPCAYSYVVFSDTCTPVDDASSVVGEQKNMFDYNITAGFRWIVVETIWQDAAVTMDYDLFYRPEKESPRGTITGTGWGKSPLRSDFWPSKHWNGTVGAARGGPTDFPDGTEPFVFRTETWYDGQYQTEINQQGSAVCPLGPLTYCSGVGVALQMRFTNYVSIFMNGVPASIQEYSAVPPP